MGACGCLTARSTRACPAVFVCVCVEHGAVAEECEERERERGRDSESKREREREREHGFVFGRDNA